ncbi:sigma-70 family RNA polymerase sigma factor [Streptomyces sp. NPDC056222]|uniref:sigma-70 family RNA polymerase sigma factor n=1 Tax=Streptomyces sp. NPDC056222 TaxID=3345749 RepID=UPI0035DEEBCE
MGAQHGTELVRAAQSGDLRAQDRLIATYLPLVYNIVGRAMNGHHDVDDVVQETMLRALDGLGGLRSPDSFRSWLVAIAMNGIRNHWRAQQSGLRPDVLDDARDLAHPGADFVDLTVVRLNLSGQRRETAEATRWMEPDDSALLSLWWLECAGELTRHEVAAALELTTEHTAVRVQRMKAQLEAARVVVRALSAQPLCPTLRSELGGWDGRPSALWRKRIARHARACAHCAGLWSGLVPAEGLLAGLLLVPPAGLLLASVRESAGFGLAAATGPLPAAPYASGGPAAPEGPYASGGPAAPEGTYEAAVTETAHMPAVSEGARRPAATGGRHKAGGSRAAQGSRGDRRRQEQQRKRGRRRAVVAAGIAVVAVTGGSFYLITGPQDDVEALDAVDATQAGAPGAALSVSPSPTTASASATASKSTTPSPSKSASPSASRTATPRPTKPAPTRTTSPAPKPKSTQTTGGSGSDSTAGEVVAIVNSERAKAGCGPLTENSLLNQAAQGHSVDMAARDFFDHTNPDGDGPGERVTATGYRWSTYGENIAMGQRTPAQVMESWMNSPGHRANILNCSFKEIGIGIHNDGGPYWTQVFGAR